MQILLRPSTEDFRIVGSEPDWRRYADLVGMKAADASRLRYADLLKDWADLHGVPVAELRREADLEDWTESAVRLIAAVKTGYPVHVLARGGLDVARSFGDESFDSREDTIFQGMVQRYDPLFISAKAPVNLVWPPNGRLGGGASYWRSEILLEAMGRRAIVSSGDAEGDDGYIARTRELINGGAMDLLAKIIFQAKYQNPTDLDLRSGSDDGSIRSAFFDAFDVNMLDCEGRSECFLIQERRPLAHEYRVVVVGGDPVAGAGTVEWLCPIFHDPADGMFDPQVETRRGDHDLARRPDIVERFVERARSLCASLEEVGDRRFRNCTMDFAIDASNGQVSLIETNPLDNFGLYAMDFSPVMSAISSNAEELTLDQAPKPHEAFS